VTTVTSSRRGRALPADLKAIRAIKRALDPLEPQERQRAMDWANAYAEGVGQAASARYRMALEAILLTSHFDAPSIAERALR
jgi:hypothetical protein